MTADVRPLTADDLDWAVDAGRARREAMAAWAPRFWRPAPDAAERHRGFLARLVDDPTALTLRSDHGYLVALGDDSRRVVDDMVSDQPRETEALLRHVRTTTATVRLAVPVGERGKRDAAEALGFKAVESWWHRDLPPVQVRRDGDRVELSTDGGRGRLVPAPPVHDPGGPVLLVTQLDTARALAAIEDEAAQRGATVSVVSQRADDLMRELILVESGHLRTTVFLELLQARA